MNLNEYQRAAMEACAIPFASKKDMLRHAAFALASEAGEVTGILQKEYQGHPMDSLHLRKEIGDCLWVIAEACTAIGVDLEDVARLNLNKLHARYPEGFSAERSLHRAPGDI